MRLAMSVNMNSRHIPTNLASACLKCLLAAALARRGNANSVLLTKVKYSNSKRLGNMNKPTMMATVVMAALFAAVAVGSTPQAFAQYFGGGSEPLTQDQIQFCKDNGVDPCTQNNILAKERVLHAQSTTYGNAPSGSGTPMLSTGTGQMAVFIGVLGAIFGGVAAMFFFKGRGAKPVTT